MADLGVKVLFAFADADFDKPITLSSYVNLVKPQRLHNCKTCAICLKWYERLEGEEIGDDEEEETRATSNHRGEEEDGDIITVDKEQEEGWEMIIVDDEQEEEGDMNEDQEEGGEMIIVDEEQEEEGTSIRNKRKGIFNEEEWTGGTPNYRDDKEESSAHAHIPVSQNIKRPLRAPYDSDKDVPRVSCGPLDTDDEEESFSTHARQAVIPVSQNMCDNGEFVTCEFLPEEMAKHTKTHNFRCPFCGKERKKETDLLSHMRKEHPQELVDCGFVGCGKKFLPQDVLEHFNTHGETFSCPFCPSKLGDKKNLPFHIRNIHPEKFVDCGFEGCGKKHLPEDTAEHLKTHGEKVSCPFCSTKIRHKKNLPSHMRNKHPEKFVDCGFEGCGKKHLPEDTAEHLKTFGLLVRGSHTPRKR